MEGGFHLPVQYIEDTVKETWHGITAMLREVKEQYALHPGNNNKSDSKI